MVRLRVLAKLICLTTSRFQFHYGTIESSVFFIVSPLWLISIPLWYDWEVLVSTLTDCHVIISIPLWYDWERRSRYPPTERLSFQFHYGTIESVKFCSCSSNIKITFQFHYGTIERTNTSRCLIYLLRFQFHYGTIESERKARTWPVCDISIPLWYDWE